MTETLTDPKAQAATEEETSTETAAAIEPVTGLSVLRTFAVGPIAEISKWKKLPDDDRGVCRVTILGDAPGPASQPPKVTFYVKDGGTEEYPLRPDEARRCAKGLKVGERVMMVGNLGPERAKAKFQEVILTQEVSKREIRGGDATRPADPEWIVPPKVSRDGGADRPAARRIVSGGPLVVLFTGSRRWTDRLRVRRDLEGLPPGSVVIQGGAPGLDTIVREECESLHIQVGTFPALWDQLGKVAGFRRNEAMARVQPDFVYAYPLPDSVGTRHMIDIAERQGIQVREA